MMKIFWDLLEHNKLAFSLAILQPVLIFINT